MGKTADDIYEAWDLSKVATPARSTLYAQKPVGVGTALVESLTSYITRLADAHSVFCGRLIEQMIVPLVPGRLSLEGKHGLFRGNGNKSNLVNATGMRALYAVQALETLTLRTDLHHLTLLFLAEGFHSRGLIRHTKAWCPVCYEEWRSTGQVVYDPLLWVFLDISICMRHKQRLQTRCLYQDCGHSFQPLAWRAQPGYCPFCQRWLGMSLEAAEKVNEPLSEAEIPWQQWVSDTLGTTLTVAPAFSGKPEREQVSKVMAHVTQQLSGGYVSVLARTLGLGIAQLGQWVRNEKVPQMDMLLRICYALGLSLHEVLFHDPDILHPQIRSKVLPPQSWQRRPSLPIDRESLRQELEKARESDTYPPLSLSVISRRLGHQQTILYQCNAEACHAIVRRYKDYLRQRKKAHMQSYREEMKQVALQLRSEGVTLTRKHIRPHLTSPAIVRNPEIRELMDEVIRELEMSDGAKQL
jgi:transcriptional regulator with XRE-family HTH domain